MSNTSGKHPIRRLLAVAAAVPLALGLAVGPAGAAGNDDKRGSFFQEPTPYQDSGTFDPECADVDVSVAFEVKGVDSLRNVPGSNGQAFLLKDRFRFMETWSEASTGEVLFTVRGAYRVEEVKAVRVRKAAVPKRLVPPEGLVGPIYRFTVVERGHDTVRDADGKTLFRTRGVVVFKNLFDTLGDGEPGGVSLSFEPVKVVGPHPLLDVDLCDVAAEQAERVEPAA